MKTMLIFAVGLVGAMMMQMPTTPPMRMGLWEMETTTTMNMPNMPANMPPGMGTHTTRVTSCLTPESWAKSLAASQQQRSDCVRSNETWSSKGYSFDIACSKGKMTGHFDFVFDGKEAGHGTTHMTMESPRGTATMDATTTSKFVSSDCGAVTPDKPVVR